jgi:hypothetical protein
VLVADRWHIGFVVGASPSGLLVLVEGRTRADPRKIRAISQTFSSPYVAVVSLSGWLRAGEPG